LNRKDLVDHPKNVGGRVCQVNHFDWLITQGWERIIGLKFQCNFPCHVFIYTHCYCYVTVSVCFLKLKMNCKHSMTLAFGFLGETLQNIEVKANGGLYEVSVCFIFNSIHDDKLKQFSGALVMCSNVTFSTWLPIKNSMSIDIIIITTIVPQPTLYSIF